MRVLAIGLDSRLALSPTPGNEAQRRQQAYAGQLIQLTIICKTSRDSRYASRNLGANLVVYPTRSRNRWFFLPDAWRLGKQLLQAAEYDLITTQDPFACGLVGFLLARRFKIPLNVQVHSDFFQNQFWRQEKWLHPWLERLGKFICRQAASLRVVNQASANTLREMGIEAKRIFVCPIGIELSLFGTVDGTKVRQKYLRAEQEYLVLSVGRLDPAKDYPTLLKTALLVREQWPRARFLIVGGGKLQTEITALIAKEKLAETVILAGSVDYGDLPAFYAACDLFLLTSSYEGFGRVLVEAGAAGKPVVSTATAGGQEIVQDRKTGLLVPVGDAPALAAAVIQILESPALSQQMGAAGKARAAEFDFALTREKLLAGWRQTT